MWFEKQKHIITMAVGRDTVTYYVRDENRDSVSLLLVNLESFLSPFAKYKDVL